MQRRVVLRIAGALASVGASAAIGVAVLDPGVWVGFPLTATLLGGTLLGVDSLMVDPGAAYRVGYDTGWAEGRRAERLIGCNSVVVPIAGRRP